MSATQRVVILLSEGQKAELARRAANERVSVSDYVRHRVFDDQAELAELVSQLNASTDRANNALDKLFKRLDQATAGREAAEAETRKRAESEFSDLDLRAVEALVHNALGTVA